VAVPEQVLAVRPLLAWVLFLVPVAALGQALALAP